MKNCILFKILGLMAFTIILLSCSAEDGEPGPQGPQGEQGPEGNSNVISSGWFGIDTWPFDEPFFKVQTIYELTDSQLENASILVYRRRSNILVEALPIFLYNSNGEIIRETRINIFNNDLRVAMDGREFEIQSDEYLPPEIEFRYVIMEPPSTADKAFPVDFSKMSYEEVIDYFGLEP